MLRASDGAGGHVSNLPGMPAAVPTSDGPQPGHAVVTQTGGDSFKPAELCGRQRPGSKSRSPPPHEKGKKERKAYTGTPRQVSKSLRCQHDYTRQNLISLLENPPQKTARRWRERPTSARSGRNPSPKRQDDRVRSPAKAPSNARSKKTAGSCSHLANPRGTHGVNQFKAAPTADASKQQQTVANSSRDLAERPCVHAEPPKHSHATATSNAPNRSKSTKPQKLTRGRSPLAPPLPQNHIYDEC